jgi:hypothetical protein
MLPRCNKEDGWSFVFFSLQQRKMKDGIWKSYK